MKDKRTEVVEKLIDKSWSSKKAFAESVDIPYTTLRSMLQRGIGNASVNNVIKVCKGLGITTEELERMASDKEDNTPITIAAHHDGDEWTEEELEEIEKFKEYLRSKRDKQ
ncbi:helix-turn-helix transcriptional regulator [Virgibacillus chiguensis]|uniref:HTH cro/C1-type domain-containing protein n=1 Tax=Virgibacillus chiguensis TaxID=411959 RepID=A0A1M5N020_9BACI|nr:helix-turn-helix transcriptional regulator [Virgibacillus chiguensis]SHG82742.1 hypothetical protein SAMN05421807_10213 [Virgibacillus chiguensis]